MIVSHPDDELIFGGATLAKGEWKVICLTNGDNKVRSREFKSVMEELGLDYEIWSYLDEWGGVFESSEIKDRICDVVNEGFDKVVTHNSEGEYGHSQHISLHNIVKDIVKTNLFVFHKGSIPLDYNHLLQKLKLLKLYKSQESTMDWVSEGGDRIMDYIIYENIKKIN